jgi:hypothetical protein
MTWDKQKFENVLLNAKGPTQDGIQWYYGMIFKVLFVPCCRE